MSDLAYQDDDQAAAHARREGASTEARPGAGPWKGHAVDVGLSVAGNYVRIVIGRERRSPERRKRDREAKPLSTLGNMLFAGSISGVVFTVLLVVALVYSSILAE